MDPTTDTEEGMQQGEVIAQSDLDLDKDFGEQSSEEPPESDDKPSGDASGSEDKGSEGEKTDEEKAAAEAEEKEAYEKLSPEEKEAADKVVADKVEVDLKAAYDKLSPEEKKAADDEKAEEEALEVEKKRVVDDHAEVLSKSEKRRADTERWAQGLNQAQLDLQRENHILRKKAADPDYDPEKDESLKEVGPTEEQKAAYSEQKGRSAASLKAAYGKYGKEATDSGLAEYRELFQDDRAVQQQVMSSDMPVEEALGLVKLSKFFGKWGQDPDAIESKMRDEVTKELTPKIREVESKRIMSDLKKTSTIPKGLAGVKGATLRDKQKGSGGDEGDEGIEKDFNSLG
jgi:hypothetical protein